MTITCLSRAGDRDEDWTYVDCAGPHAGELVGVVTDGGQPEVSCAAAAESYVGDGFRTRHDLRLMWIADEPHLRCFAVDPVGDNALHGSVKGVGSGPLPR
jgi:hypothetical protein